MEFDKFWRAKSSLGIVAKRPIPSLEAKKLRMADFPIRDWDERVSHS